MTEHNDNGSPREPKPGGDAELAADLEEIWQQESPDTARRTQVADEVDGELGTRPGRRAGGEGLRRAGAR
jgi:hypothetical protein